VARQNQAAARLQAAQMGRRRLTACAGSQARNLPQASFIPIELFRLPALVAPTHVVTVSASLAVLTFVRRTNLRWADVTLIGAAERCEGKLVHRERLQCARKNRLTPRGPLLSAWCNGPREI